MEQVGAAPLGALLRRQREQRGLTQEELAECAGPGLSVNTIGNIERGRTKPFRHTLEVLCDALQLDEEERILVLQAGSRAGTGVFPRGEGAASRVRREVDLPDWLPATKLSPPAARPDVISRPRLVDALQRGIEQHRLVLISAPAGSGKTTLVSTGLRELAVTRSWVALDEEDNDPARFLALFIAGAGRLQPHVASTAQLVLDNSPDPAAHIRQIVGALINDIVPSPAPLVLALDDLHLVTEPAVFAALDYLLERLPTQLHLVVATRHEPPLALARLRARGELAEIHFPDLRFTAEEAAVFLRERHLLKLSDEDLSLLDERTGGWAAGIRLLANALTHLPAVQERGAFLAELTRVDRQMFTLLAEEVLRREPPEMQDFLLETSILSHLTPSLCRGVTGREDAAFFLDTLERRNLFVTALDEPGELTFRYHDLFAGFLRRELERRSPERVTELHWRAAEVHPVATEAIGHLFAAERWEEAAERIEVAGESFLRRGLIDTLIRWLRVLPSDVIDSRPRLQYLHGLSLWRRGETAQARSILERAAPGLAMMGAEEEHGEATAALATIALMEGDRDRSLRLIERALSLPIRSATRIQLLLERGRARLWHGVREAALADLDSAVQVSAQAGSEETVAALITYLHPIFGGLPGGLKRVEQVCRVAAARLPGEDAPIRGTLDQQLTLVHLRRGDFDACIEAGRRALTYRERYGSVNPLMDLWAIWSLAVVHAARRRYQEAEKYCTMLFQIAALGEAQRAPAMYTWGWVCWLQGRYREVREANREICSLEPLLPVTPILQKMLHGLLMSAEGNHVGADEVLQQAINQVRELRVSMDLHGNPALLRAHVHLVMGQPRRALDGVTAVLAAAERENAPGFIAKEGEPMIPLMQLARERGMSVGVAAAVLEALGTPPEGKPLRVPGTGEVLSRREVELLRLLATGATNREIAERLVIGDQTVKTHVSHILRKLDASSRTEAAARARELRLL